MQRYNVRLIFGVLLILAGAVFLAENVGLIQMPGSVWGFLFALGGLAFLSVLLFDRRQWWAAIPGLVLLSLGAIIFLDEIAPAMSDRIGGGVFLGGIGLAFWVVYFLAPSNWWAIIPGGVLLTLAAVATLDNVPGLETGGIFFLGLAATFGLLSLVRVEGRRMGWPLIPAGILAVMGLMILASAADLMRYLWPLVIIAVGLFLLLRGFSRRDM